MSKDLPGASFDRTLRLGKKAKDSLSKDSLDHDSHQLTEWYTSGGEKCGDNRPLNTKIIGGNIAEAAEQLAKLLHTILTGKLNEADLQVGLRHAYHHLNFAWNIRRLPTSEYMALTSEAI